METNCGNIYFSARKTAGLTQERWAELLGLSVDAVGQYERDVILPSDEVVLRMAEAAGQQIICYWHLLHKSRCAGKVLPEVEARPLSEAVLGLLHRLESFSAGGMKELVRIGADGKVDKDEQESFADCMSELQSLIRAAYELHYAEGKGAGGRE